VLACGHQCGGIANEEECLPCLHNCPPYQGKLKQDADDMCMICFTEALSAAPAIQVCAQYSHDVENHQKSTVVCMSFISPSSVGQFTPQACSL
jgi:hypothetical protein